MTYLHATRMRMQNGPSWAMNICVKYSRNSINQNSQSDQENKSLVEALLPPRCIEYAEIDHNLDSAPPLWRLPMRRLETWANKFKSNLNTIAQYNGWKRLWSPPRHLEDTEINCDLNDCNWHLAADSRFWSFCREPIELSEF